MLLLCLLLLLPPAVSQMVSLMLWSPTCIRLMAKSTPGDSTAQHSAQPCAQPRKMPHEICRSLFPQLLHIVSDSTTNCCKYLEHLLLPVLLHRGFIPVLRLPAAAEMPAAQLLCELLTHGRWQLRLKLVSNEPAAAEQPQHTATPAHHY